jgi:hypothetical protein
LLSPFPPRLRCQHPPHGLCVTSAPPNRALYGLISFQTPPTLLSSADRASIAKDALDVLIQSLYPSVGGPDGELFLRLASRVVVIPGADLDFCQASAALAPFAEYDALTGGNTYKNTVVSVLEKLASVDMVVTSCVP